MLDKFLKFEKDYIGILNSENEFNNVEYIKFEDAPHINLECLCVKCPVCEENKIICGCCIISSNDKKGCICPNIRWLDGKTNR